MSFICTWATAWIMQHDDFVKNWLIQLKIFTYFEFLTYFYHFCQTWNLLQDLAIQNEAFPVFIFDIKVNRIISLIPILIIQYGSEGEMLWPDNEDYFWWKMSKMEFELTTWTK